MANQFEIISELKSEAVYTVDAEKGINQPGIWSGQTYKDSNGVLVHKYTCQTVFSNGHASIMARVTAAEPEPEDPPAEDPPEDEGGV